MHPFWTALGYGHVTTSIVFMGAIAYPCSNKLLLKLEAILRHGLLITSINFSRVRLLTGALIFVSDIIVMASYYKL